MTTYVLVHGALHGSWCWERVTRPLRDAGHAVDAVNLPGRDGTGSTDLEAYTRVVAAAVNRAQPPVILVGHSFGGVTVSQFVESAPDAVAGLILVNALLVEDGEAVLPKIQTAGEECVFLQPGALVFSEDGSTVSVARSFVVDGLQPLFRDRRRVGCSTAVRRAHCTPDGAAADHCGRIRLCTKGLPWLA